MNTIEMIKACIEPVIGSVRVEALDPASIGEHYHEESGPPVEIEGMVIIYPERVEVDTIGGIRIVRWSVDVLVDASEPDAGLFGCEPVQHSKHETFAKAVTDAALLIAEDRIASRFEALADEGDV